MSAFVSRGSEPANFEIIANPARAKGGITVLATETIDDACNDSHSAGPDGRSVDHLGFSFAGLDAEAARLMAMGVTFTMDPRPFGPLKTSFIEGPAGVRIEVVQPAAAQDDRKG